MANHTKLRVATSIVPIASLDEVDGVNMQKNVMHESFRRVLGSSYTLTSDDLLHDTSGAGVVWSTASTYSGAWDGGIGSTIQTKSDGTQNFLVAGLDNPNEEEQKAIWVKHTGFLADGTTPAGTNDGAYIIIVVGAVQIGLCRLYSNQSILVPNPGDGGSAGDSSSLRAWLLKPTSSNDVLLEIASFGD